MKTILVIAQHPELSDAIRAVVDGERHRIIQRATIEEAEPLLANGLADACVLDAEAMLRQFLLMLREIVSINRAVIFMRPPPPSFAEQAGQESRRLRAVGSLGISTGLLEHFELSLEGGIGGLLIRLGRIIKLQ